MWLHDGAGCLSLLDRVLTLYVAVRMLGSFQISYNMPRSQMAALRLHSIVARQHVHVQCPAPSMSAVFNSDWRWAVHFQSPAHHSQVITVKPADCLVSFC